MLAAIVVPLVFLGGPSQPTAGSAPSPLPGVITRTAFRFDPPTLRISALGRNKATTATDAAAESIRSSLSTFYDQAFVDPTTWTRGIPAAAWDLFSPDVRARAQQDAASLGLGSQVPTLTRFTVTQATLGMRLLVDPRGAIQVVGADVQFVAEGGLKDGRVLQLTNRASFLLRPVKGQWLIFGYPLSTTQWNVVAPSPSPIPTTSPTPTASGASP